MCRQAGWVFNFKNYNLTSSVSAMLDGLISALTLYMAMAQSNPGFQLRLGVIQCI
jgi:hypothetical protein